MSPSATAAFAAYVRVATEHYVGRGVRFEVWNEPDNEFWTPTDPVAYAAVAAVVIDAVHAADPTALVSTGGISWFDFEFLEAALRAGAATGADAIGVHPYRGTSPPESLPDHVIYARALIRREVGRDVPLWDTEWGYTATQFGAGDSAAARQRQAVMAVRELMSARLVGFPLAVWYDLRDDGTDPQAGEHNFGLIANDGSDKPAIVALRALRAAALGRTVAGVIDVAQPAFSGVRLDGADDTVLVLWSTSPEVSVSVPNPVAATDMFGAPLALATSYTLAESNGPIYLTFERAPDGGVGQAGAGGTGSAGTGATAAGGIGAGAAGTSGGAGASAGGASAADGGTTETGVSGGGDDSGGCACRAKNVGAPSSGWVTAALLAGFATLCRRRRA
jgi:MYXO-CTERM domain-containing protein